MGKVTANDQSKVLVQSFREDLAWGGGGRKEWELWLAFFFSTWRVKLHWELKKSHDSSWRIILKWDRFTAQTNLTTIPFSAWEGWIVNAWGELPPSQNSSNHHFLLVQGIIICPFFLRQSNIYWSRNYKLSIPLLRWKIHSLDPDKPKRTMQSRLVIFEEELANTPWGWKAGPRTLLVHL